MHVQANITFSQFYIYHSLQKLRLFDLSINFKSIKLYINLFCLTNGIPMVLRVSTFCIKQQTGIFKAKTIIKFHYLKSCFMI